MLSARDKGMIDVHNIKILSFKSVFSLKLYNNWFITIFLDF